MDEGIELSEPPLKTRKREAPLEGLVVADSYRVNRLLGSGGMGDVYEAEHVRLGSAVAIKFMRGRAGDASRSVERFRREAKRIAALRSDHIVKVFDYGELADGTPYLVMERLAGEDLRGLLDREGPLPIRRAVKLLCDACEGLAFVHRAGLVHRDLKPANLFVETLSLGVETCKILDFGVAKAPASDSTHQGTLVGTIRYMAPEQLEDASSATSRADVYALGAILYECLCGVAANAGESLQDTMFSVLHRSPKPPSELRSMPRALEAVVLRALSRDPGARYRSAEELGRALLPFTAIERAPALMEAADEDTSNDAVASTRGQARGHSRHLPSTILVLLATLGLGGAAGWVARGAKGTASVEASARARPSAEAVTPVLRPPFALVAPPASSTPAVVLTPRPPAAAPAPPVSARSTAGGERSHVPGRTAPRLSPRQVPSVAPIAGRFDPSDPYE